MKRILALMPVFLLTLSLSAQQAKPSPSTSQGAIPELKETPKSQSANSQSPGTTVLSSTLPVGTPVHMKLETPLYSASTKAGDNFSGRVLEDVKLADKVIIPVGASLQGHVVVVRGLANCGGCMKTPSRQGLKQVSTRDRQDPCLMKSRHGSKAATRGQPEIPTRFSSPRLRCS